MARDADAGSDTENAGGRASRTISNLIDRFGELGGRFQMPRAEKTNTKKAQSRR